MAMIVCPGCGKYISGDEAFCPYCGKSTKPEKAQQQSVPQQQSAPQQRQSAPQPQAIPVYTNPGYVPPVYPQQPAVPSYEFNGKTGKGMGWIVFMRVILWIIFAGMVIAGVVMAIEIIDYDVLIAVAYILGSVLSAFIIVAGGMIALNNATNLRSIAMNTAKTVELLQQIKRK